MSKKKKKKKKNHTIARNNLSYPLVAVIKLLIWENGYGILEEQNCLLNNIVHYTCMLQDDAFFKMSGVWLKIITK